MPQSRSKTQEQNVASMKYRLLGDSLFEYCKSAHQRNSFGTDLSQSSLNSFGISIQKLDPKKSQS